MTSWGRLWADDQYSDCHVQAPKLKIADDEKISVPLVGGISDNKCVTSHCWRLRAPAKRLSMLHLVMVALEVALDPFILLSPALTQLVCLADVGEVTSEYSRSSPYAARLSCAVR